MNTKQSKYTLADFNKQFPDEESCLEWLKNYIYPDSIYCRQCEQVTPHSRLMNRKAYSCNRCGSHVYPMVNTIFERSTTPLKYWFYAIFLLSHTRCGISAKQLQRELGVTYKTAWRMFKEIRKLFMEDTPILTGKVELDETYIGGRKAGKPGRGASGKTTVFGIMSRDGNLKANVTEDLTKITLYPMIKENIVEGTMLYTDEFAVYNHLTKIGYKHEKVNHASKVYAIGDVHTNNIEGFWSVLKRGIYGVYHNVSPKYMQSYVNEYSFRYNHKTDMESMFETVLNRV